MWFLESLQIDNVIIFCIWWYSLLKAHLLNYIDELPNNNDRESYISFLNSINYE